MSSFALWLHLLYIFATIIVKHVVGWLARRCRLPAFVTELCPQKVCCIRLQWLGVLESRRSRSRFSPHHGGFGGQFPVQGCDTTQHQL